MGGALPSTGNILPGNTGEEEAVLRSCRGQIQCTMTKSGPRPEQDREEESALGMTVGWMRMEKRCRTVVFLA